MQGYWKTYKKREIDLSSACNFKHRRKEYAKVIYFTFLILLNSICFQNINEKTWNSVNFDLIFLRLDFISQITIKKSLSREILKNIYKRENLKKIFYYKQQKPIESYI